MPPMDGYVRVSRVGERGGESFISPEVQENAIRTWAKRNGVEVVMQPPELNVSGGTMDRPIFNEVMARVRDGRSGGIVVYKTDRFARSLLGAVSTLTELGKHGARFASATEPELDYTTPGGQAFLHTLFTFAEFVRSNVKESWAVAQRHKTESGVHISPNGYLGYDKGADGRLVPNEDAPVVAELFRRRGAAGEGWGALAGWLDETAPKPDDKLWTGQAVQRLCSKRVYLGEASRYVGQDKDNRGPVVNSSAHPPLVTEDEWRAAQMTPRSSPSPNGQPLPLLSGLIRCAGCRFSLSRGRGPKGEALYRCRGKHTSGKCPSPAMILAERIESYVEETVLSEIDGLVQMVPDSSERTRATERLERTRADLDSFRLDGEAHRKLGPDWHDWLDTYLAAVRQAEAEVERLNMQVGAVREGLTRDAYLQLARDERREVLGGFIDAVFVRRSRGRGRNADPIEDRARILWRGEAPADLPRRRVLNEIRSFDFEDHVEPGVAAAQHGT